MSRSTINVRVGLVLVITALALYGCGLIGGQGSVFGKDGLSLMKTKIDNTQSSVSELHAAMMQGQETKLEVLQRVDKVSQSVQSISHAAEAQQKNRTMDMLIGGVITFVVMSLLLLVFLTWSKTRP